MAILLDSYSEANKNQDQWLFSTFPAGFCIYGQMFKTPNDGTQYVLTTATFYIIDNEVGATGTFQAELYADDGGTYGTDSKPTGAILATSAERIVTSFNAAYTLEAFDFSGDPYTMDSNTAYGICLKKTGGDAQIKIGYDNSTPTHGGLKVYWAGGGWTAVAGDDLCFYVYGEVADTYSPATRSSLPSTMSTMLNSKMFYSALKFPSFGGRLI